MIKLDDTHKDYFVNDPEENAGTGTTQDGKVIDFSQGGTTPMPKPKRGRKVLWWTIAVCVAVLAVVFYLRYCSPYVEDARMTGFVTKVEKRGMIFKTYEADFISEAALTDTTRVYSHDVSFSVDNPEVIARLQQMQGTGRTVTVVYETYYATLPWRGESKSVITEILNQ